ncbi:hypothetical protein GCM10009069_30010 [Algimonas arctica]|uniref:Uncharacterized protein n=1 Tax=Algimonas arctica TaxID=1479486 RepID=A0A8J3CTT8_9PROT|nr:hypothetical protein GCM10009069_30010 [Algimonas arctica]
MLRLRDRRVINIHTRSSKFNHSLNGNLNISLNSNLEKLTQDPRRP